MDIRYGPFSWVEKKEAENILKHDIDFETASLVFLDPQRRTFRDLKHSTAEERMFCIGRVGGKIMTVRYTRREGFIRIIGAGYWRQGRRYYDEETPA